MKLNGIDNRRAQGLSALGRIITSLVKQGLLALAALVHGISGIISRFIKPAFVSLHEKTGRAVASVSSRIRTYISKNFAKFNKVKAHIIRVYKNGGLKKAIKFFVFGDRRNGYKRSPLSAFCNYAAPVVCAVLLFNIVAYATNIQYVVGVSFGDGIVAYVENQSVYEEAEGELRSRLNYSESNDSYVELEPEFTVVKNDSYDLLDKYRLADILLTCTSNDVAQGCGVYVGTEFFGAVEDKTAVEAFVNKTIEEQKNAVGGESAELETDIIYTEGLYLKSSVKTDEEMQNVLGGTLKAPISYTVCDGDYPELIAAKLGIDAEKFSELNPDIAPKLIPGETVVINTVKPCISVLVYKNETRTEEIPFEKETVKDDTKSSSSMPVVTRAGENGSKDVTYKKTYRNNIEISAEVISSVVTKEAVSEQTTVGTMNVTQPASTQTSDMYIWPVGGSGGYVSTYLYGYSGHTGIDIANDAGTPIYAAADGVVVEAQTHNAYGKLIIIRHSNGMLTYYAHCRYLGVTAGQTVSQGDFIGEVGMTGNATGNHLHFEVRGADGSILNPLDYLTR
ncbi:MAG: LysM peptidoglycan-binding domain-containing M23 family metallopeptidase [Oscillospiraceae bacterium]